MWIRLTPSERARLRAVTHCADETIKKFANHGPEKVTEASALRLTAGCAELGIALPAAPPQPQGRLSGTRRGRAPHVPRDP
jgi:hypothetical protein